MGFQRVVNSLIRAFEKEAIELYERDSVSGKSKCQERENDWWCCRYGDHDVHIATSGKDYLLQVWFEDHGPFKGESHGKVLNLLLYMIQQAAAAENKAKVRSRDYDAGDEGQCCQESPNWRCTRPSGHTGFHVALRDHEELLEIWDPHGRR